jgi:hypothetical protein
MDKATFTTSVSDRGEVKIVMTRDRAAKLVELIGRHVDLDVVELDNDDPDGARFVRELLADLRGTLDTAEAAAEGPCAFHSPPHLYDCRT